MSDRRRCGSLLYDGRHYDRIYGKFYSEARTEDIDFLVKLAQQRSTSILELCCGTGRVAIPLAEEGFQVTGIDLSDSMLQEARRRSSAVQWVKADVTDFNLNQTFDLIIFPINSICHLTRLDAIEACFACVKQHLKPEGRFFIELFNFANRKMLDELHSNQRTHLSTYEDPDGHGKIEVNYTNNFDLAQQINQNTFFFKLPEQAEEVVETVIFRCYFPQELKLLLTYNGFVVEESFGDYHRSELTSSSFYDLLICRLRN